KLSVDLGGSRDARPVHRLARGANLEGVHNRAIEPEDCEGLQDGLGIFGKALAVGRGIRPLAALSGRLQLEREQLAEQKVARGALELVQKLSRVGSFTRPDRSF